MADGIAGIEPILGLTGQITSIDARFRQTWRLNRLRHSQWQWFSMVMTMLFLHVQHEFPPIVEIMVALVFGVLLIFAVRGLVSVGR